MKFVFAKTHPLCSPSWLVVIDTMDLLLHFHRRVTVRAALKYGNNPHLFDENGAPKNAISVFFNPVSLGTRWLQSAEKFFFQDGVVYMNSVGGLTPRPDVLTVQESEVWPQAEPMEGELVEISKWPNGNHYYLYSSKGRIFPQEKCNSYAEAVDMANRFAPGCKIGAHKAYGANPTIYAREGD